MSYMRKTSVGAVSALAAIWAATAGAQCLSDKVTPQDPGFGSSVAISGEVAVVGAQDVGRAYVLRYDGMTFVEEQELIAPGVVSADDYGFSIDVDGDVAIVGAPQDDDVAVNAGAAYVFRRNGTGWLMEAKLLASDGASTDHFGWDVAISGDVAVIGSPEDDEVSPDSGSVYVYRFDGVTWVEEDELVASDAISGDTFGLSVAIDDNRVLVGAPGLASLSAGKAYVFLYNGNWVEFDVLEPSDGAFSDGFGFSVSFEDMDDDVAVVGAPAHGAAGAAYVFVDGIFPGFQEAQKLTPSPAQANEFFGGAVSVAGDVIVIGDMFADAVNFAGAAHLYVPDGSSWIERWWLVPADGQPDAEFGVSVAVGDEFALVGAQSDSPSGAVYVYAGFGDCNGNGEMDCDDIFAGTSSDLDGNAVPDECQLLAYNVTAETAHSTIDDAIREAIDNDVVVASEITFGAEPDIDFQGVEMTLRSMGNVAQHFTGFYQLTDGARLEAADDMTINGMARVEPGASVDLCASPVHVNGSLIGRTGSYTLIDSGTISMGGNVRIEAGATLDCAGSTIVNDELLLLGASMFALELEVVGVMTMSDALYAGGGILVPGFGRLNASGEIFAPVHNDQDVYCLGDTLVVGDYTNDGTTTIQVGMLTIVGSLTNNGTIIGDIVFTIGPGGGTEAGDGLDIAGDYAAGSGAALLMPDPVWRFGVSGDYDVAIDDNTRYHMADAELHLRAGGGVQTMERMSLDVGASTAGFDPGLPGHFPLGTLRVGSGATVDLVDAHDNDLMGQGSCEVVYARTLIVEAGATLDTNGCTVYYETLALDGAVDDPLNLVGVEPCAADVSGDGQVGVVDLLLLLAVWGPAPGDPSDFNGDGFVDVVDLLQLLSDWGPC